MFGEGAPALNQPEQDDDSENDELQRLQNRVFGEVDAQAAAAAAAGVAPPRLKGQISVGAGERRVKEGLCRYFGFAVSGSCLRAPGCRQLMGYNVAALLGTAFLAKARLPILIRAELPTVLPLAAKLRPS